MDNLNKTKCPLINKGPRNNIPFKRMLQNLLDEVYSIQCISTFCHFRGDREKASGEAPIVSQFFKNVESNVYKLAMQCFRKVLNAKNGFSLFIIYHKMRQNHIDVSFPKF